MSRIRKSYARLLCSAAVSAVLAGAGAAHAEDRFDIAPQPLATALKEFGMKTGQPVLYGPALADHKVSAPVVGAPDAEAALVAMLDGTGLTYRRSGDTFLIERADAGPQSGSAAGDGAEVEALIVTAQKKEEDIQDVPIAISAFTQDTLDAQKIEGGYDLLKAIPNVTFSKNNFSGYNFSIRGVGTKAISATTDPGVAVSFNNTALIVNRLFEQEYYDVERVEVLRGPQGTLYGRNATSGVINVISARPRLGEFQGDVELEVGNYNARRLRGMINVPLGDSVAVRLAGALTKRDGYGFNEADGSDVDDRDLWSTRVTVGWEPTDGLRANLLWERFEEDDARVRTSKQLCHRDDGPEAIGEFSWAEDVTAEQIGAPIYRGLTSQGCKAGSLYDDGAFGTPNGTSLPFISALFFGPAFGVGFFNLWAAGFNPNFMQPTAPCDVDFNSPAIFPINVCQFDPYGGRTQSRDLRTIHSLLEPTYRATADIFELSIEADIGDSLSFASQTVYNQDEYYASQDYNRFTTLPVFGDTAIACATIDILFDPPAPCNPGMYAGGFYNVSPGGVFNDPQLGPSNTLVAQDLSKAESEQFNQEFRVASRFAGPVNFSVGANYTKFETWNDYYVFANAFTLLTHYFPFNTNENQLGGCGEPACVYVDPNPLASINGEGHNYFRSANPYELESKAIFGEVYWQAAETVKITAGLRFTWDEKVFTPIPSQTLLWDYRDVVPEGAGWETCLDPTASNIESCNLAGTGENGRGYPAEPDIVQKWSEPTGRLVVDWKPDLAWTDDSMFYASYAHGYKGGGANPPGIANPSGALNARNSGGVTAPPTFEAEFVDAFEAGSKNVALGGALVLNATAFYYDYKDYQVSKIVDRSAANENFDAEVWGAELEWVFSPSRALRFNGAFGYLDTKVGNGELSIDLMDRVQGGNQTFGDFDRWMVLKPWIASTSNCVVPTAVVEAVLTAGEGIGGLAKLCPGGNVLGNDYRPGNIVGEIPGIGYYDPDVDAPNGGAGFFDDVSGNELPNAPHWTAALGAQYRFGLPSGWEATLRGDLYWQSQSFARIYNTQYDKLRAWTNTNVSLWFEQPDWQVTVEVYVKNVFDEEPITDAFLNSDDSGLTTNVFTLDPRLVGVSVRKQF